MLGVFAGKRILLLQGPMGPFFWRLGKDLQAVGAQVTKVNFCGGDSLFYPFGAVSFRGTLEQWPHFLAGLIKRRSIDAVVLFGDCRSYHHSVRDILRWLKVETYVFEEGYLRPDYITLEKGGVNNFSSMPRDPAAFLAFKPLKPGKEPLRASRAFWRAAVYSSLYSWANYLLAWSYPHYRHHRSLHPIREGYRWLRSGVRKLWFRWRERGMLERFTGPLSKRYFLVPLQVHNDAQLTIHSRLGQVESFIDAVAKSFARHADRQHLLLFKHHPMDRAYRDYTALIRRVAARYGLHGRMFYVHDVHLPALIQHARGTIVLNSTVGLSSVHHRTPVITLENPIYNMPGLTFQGSLEEFWHSQGKINRKLYRRFRAWLLAHNQANGNFYRPLPGVRGRTGVVWPPLFGVEAPAPRVPQVRPVALPLLPKAVSATGS